MHFSKPLGIPDGETSPQPDRNVLHPCWQFPQEWATIAALQGCK